MEKYGPHWCHLNPGPAAQEIERLRSWMYEAINSLGDPQDACDHDDSEVAALRATIDEAIGKLRTGLADANELNADGK